MVMMIMSIITIIVIIINVNDDKLFWRFDFL